MHTQQTSPQSSLQVSSQISGKRLLVTGGAGFIGSSFVEMAVRQGHTVIVLDALTYAGHPENLKEVSPSSQMKLIIGNICDASLVFELLKEHSIDSVVHFAAESHVDRSISGPANFIETNIRGTFQLLSATLDYWKSLTPAAQKSFRYLQVSTDEVFGSLGDAGFFTENTPYAPNSPYSASKASADHLARAWFHTYSLPTIVTHCSNNYGPRQFPEKLIPTVLTRALANQPIPVYGTGKNIRDWIHVQDHCHGIFLALEKGTPGDHYCFGGRAEKTNLDVVQTLCHELDRMRPRTDGYPHSSGIKFVEDRLGHDWRYAIDDRKAETELGFRRKFSFDEGMRSTLEWYLTHQDWCEQVLKRKNLD